MPNPTIAAIIGQTDDPQLQAAMALGSRLEGGWSPPFPPGDQGTSFGPYQIHLPAHPGVTPAQADDPVWSTSYMSRSYAAGVNTVGDAAFAADPEAAAEQAAYHAERPAEDYYSGRGQGAVDAAWSATMMAIPSTSAAALLTGSSSGSASSGTFPPEPGLTYPYPDPTTKAQADADAKALANYLTKKGAGKFLPGNPLTGAKNAIDSAVGGAFGAVWTDAKPFLVTMGFVGLGLLLIGSGLVISTRGARSSSTTTLPAAAGGAGLGDLAALA